MGAPEQESEMNFTDRSGSTRALVGVAALVVIATLATAALAGPPAPATPNLYQFTGDGIHVSYSTTGVDGKPHLEFQNGQQTMHFTGDDIRTVKTDAGTLVSVTIRRTIDTGSTSFTVLLPSARLAAVGTSVHLATSGITTIHRFSVVPVFNTGQLDVYSVTPLSGSASLVTF
jgi:hypothetical protein